ncbi:hypothetical protein [Lysinibacillus sp. FJAT-14745]|nr:hypothetical protein [Lysinibacillus sp. FJAT-14745]
MVNQHTCINGSFIASHMNIIVMLGVSAFTKKSTVLQNDDLEKNVLS